MLHDIFHASFLWSAVLIALFLGVVFLDLFTGYEDNLNVCALQFMGPHETCLVHLCDG
jgi:hypothetical protein